MARKKVEVWRDNFKSSCLSAGFHLGLTRAMCEFLSAVADDVHWDRDLFGGSNPWPNSFLATSRSLEKRGLIERKPKVECDSKLQTARDTYETYSWIWFRLTPPGECVVKLLVHAGLFVKADMAIEKEARKSGQAKT